MSTIICNMNCSHRSKSPLRAYKNKDGSACYSCSLPYTVISNVLDPSNVIEEVFGKGYGAMCINYDPVDNETNEKGVQKEGTSETKNK